MKIIAVALAILAAVAVGACDENKELGDTACKRLTSCGQTVPQGCCVNCAPSPKLTLTYACARRINVAPTCDKALEAFNEATCIERTR